MMSSRPISVHMDEPYGGASVLPFRTPARSRGTLRENATNRKQAFQTPFKQPFNQNNTTAPHPGKASLQLADGKTAAPRTIGRVALGNKTPFPNRAKARLSGGGNEGKDGSKDAGGSQTPLAFASVGLDLGPLPALDTPGLRPSSTRKSVRRSSHGSGAFNLSGIQGLDFSTFQTPRVNGNPWDVEDIEIAAPATEEVIQEEPEADYDEIEYMPPKAQELPYEPPFEMPNYKELGEFLMNFSSMPRIDESRPPNWDNDAEWEQSIFDSCVPPVLELIDCSLSLVTPPPTPPPVRTPATASKTTTSSRSGAITRTRSATVSSKAPAAPTTTAPARRPLTSTKTTTTTAAKPTVPVPSTSRTTTVAGTSGTLTVPTAASSSRSTPAPARPIARARSAVNLAPKNTPSVPASRTTTAATTTTIAPRVTKREPTVAARSTASSRAPSRPSPPSTRASSTIPKRPATVAAIRRPVTTATTTTRARPAPATIKKTTSTAPVSRTSKLDDDIILTFDHLDIDGLSGEDFMIELSDEEVVDVGGPSPSE